MTFAIAKATELPAKIPLEMSTTKSRGVPQEIFIMPYRINASKAH
jgi:hypothetical protein